MRDNIKQAIVAGISQNRAAPRISDVLYDKCEEIHLKMRSTYIVDLSCDVLLLDGGSVDYEKFAKRESDLQVFAYLKGSDTYIAAPNKRELDRALTLVDPYGETTYKMHGSFKVFSLK